MIRIPLAPAGSPVLVPAGRRVRHRLPWAPAPAVATAGAAPTTVSSSSTIRAGLPGRRAAAPQRRPGQARAPPRGEPELYPKNEANAYGVIKDRAAPAERQRHHPHRLPHGLRPRRSPRPRRPGGSTLIAAQMKVLNDSYAGATAADAADTPVPLRPHQDDVDGQPGLVHRRAGQERARHEEGAVRAATPRTLNVYAANIGGGLLGWAYFPKGYNNGRDYIDGVVMLDESMPGGTAGKYSVGDTLTHEVGHWLMLEHTFDARLLARPATTWPTPRARRSPQFDCPIGADTCTAPGLDPIHNFMDYTQDSCMNMFTPGPGRADERRLDRLPRGGQDLTTPPPPTTPDAGRGLSRPASGVCGPAGGTLGACSRCGSRCRRP